jgi:hypothetical protein
MYHKLFKDALEPMHRSDAPGPELKKWAEEAGYVNVTETIVPLPIGLWPRDKRLVRAAFTLSFPSSLLFILSYASLKMPDPKLVKRFG